MVNKGLITTALSNTGLIISSLLLGQAITTDAYVQLAILIGAGVLAYLDIKYPREMDKFREMLQAVNQADTLSREPEEPQ